jgi:hypothetical protein
MSSPTKQIGGLTFAFGTIPAEDAIDVEVSAVRLFGEPLFHLVAGAGDGKSPDDVAAAIGAAMRALAAHPNHVALKDEIKTFIRGVIKNVSCQGNVSLDFTFFNGRNRMLWEVVAEALRANFPDILGAVPSPSAPAPTVA